MAMQQDGMENAAIPRVNPDDVQSEQPSDGANEASDKLNSNDTSDAKDKDGVDSDGKKDSGNGSKNGEKSKESDAKDGESSNKKNGGDSSKSSGSKSSDDSGGKSDSDSDSKALDNKDSEDEDNDKKDKKKKKQQQKVARQGVQMGAQYGIKAWLTAKFMMMMKMFLMMMAAIAQAAVGLFAMIFNAIVGFVQSVFSTIASAFMTAATAVANVLAVGVTAVAVSMLGGIIGLVGVIVVGAVALTNDSNTARTDTAVVEDCMSGVNVAADELEDIDSDVNQDAQTVDNAKKVYFTYKELGLTDNMLAAALANYQAEGSIDPTVIEGAESEHFNINGPKHKQILGDDPANPDYAKLSAYSKTVAQSSYYYLADGSAICGLGLIQWTGQGAKDMLESAKKQGVVWYDLRFQITYSLKSYRPTFYKEWLTKYNPENGIVKRKFVANNKTYSFKNTPQDMATYFAMFYEGNLKHSRDKVRREGAVKWLVQLPDFEAGRTEADTAEAQSILAAAQTTKIEAATTGLENASKGCEGSNKVYAGGNGSIAEAAASFAYPTKAEAVGNNGTALYKKVCDAVINDHLYKSCDHCVCAAVRWSGADDSLPAGNASTQAQYFASSDKWQKVEDYNGDMSKLQPGDILVITSAERGSAHGHVVVYAGYEAIQKAHPEIKDKNTTIVAASYGTRSAGCQPWYSELTKYTAYRNVTQESNSKYKNVLSAEKGTNPGSGDKQSEATPAPTTKK